jgi:hypothetical protein
MKFIYNLNEIEYLIFQQTDEGFDLYSRYEGWNFTNDKIASYKFGKWYWDGFNQYKLFWCLFSLYKKEFGKALKAFNRKTKPKSLTWEFNCIYRKINLEIIKYARKKRTS